MFKGLIKKLEEENLPMNGTAIRETIRDAGQAVIKQVKEKMESATSASSSATSSRTPSLIDIRTDVLPTASSPVPLVDQNLMSELNSSRRERDGLLLRNSQLNNLISQMKAELSEERNLRRSLEDEYKRPNEEIPFKVLVEKGSQTDVPAAEKPAASEAAEAAADRAERDRLLLRNAELSQNMEQLKRQMSEDRSERIDIEKELQHLKQQLLLREEQWKRELVEHEERQRQQQQKESQEVISLKDHNEMVQQLEQTVSERNKTIKLQLQRITDLKKSIQRGDLPLSSSSTTSGPTHPVVASGYFSDGESARSGSPMSQRRNQRSPPATLDLTVVPMDGSSVSDDHHAATTLSVNFEYLKNVVFKFLTSSEYESQKQLVKAISTLLNFNEQEEQSVRQTLDWRTSWLSNLPLVGPNLKPLPVNSTVQSHPAQHHNSRKSRKGTSSSS